MGFWPALFLAISPWHLHFSRIAFELIALPFLFVTERMRDEILAEREVVIALAPQSTKTRQLELLSKYDPHVSADAFQSVLHLFEIDPKS